MYGLYMVNELLNLINAERAKAGVNALVYRPDIVQASNLRAQEASLVWSHNRPNGMPYYTADDRIYGENLAKNYGSPQEILTAWLNSPSHRNNLLNQKFKGACIGMYEENGKRFISLEFTKD